MEVVLEKSGGSTSEAPRAGRQQQKQPVTPATDIFIFAAYIHTSNPSVFKDKGEQDGDYGTV